LNYILYGEGIEINRLDDVSRIYHSAVKIPFDDSSKLVFMSDVHRGDGSWADEFSKNQNLYMVALAHYDKERYTYIEIFYRTWSSSRCNKQ